MTFATPLPWWAIAAIVAAVIALAVRTHAYAPITRGRRVVLAGLRAAVLLAILLFLLRPVAVRPLSRPGNIVPVVIDASRSMAIADVPARESAPPEMRFAHALAIADGPLARALAGYRIELLEYRNEIGPLDRTRGADGDASDLGAAIASVRERYPDRSVPGIVLLSDGVDTSADLAALDREGTAVYPMAIGDPAAPRDQEVLSVDLDPEALPGSSVDLTATVVAHGYGRDPIDVRLRASGRPIELRRVIPSADGLPVRVVFELPPAAQDPAVYTVDLPPRDGEASLDNNARQALVQPIGRRRRLLFVQGSPGYEHGFLSRALAADPYLEVDAVVRKGQNAGGEATFYVQAAGARAAALASGFPSDRAALFAYDGIVLGNATRDLMPERSIDLLDAFVTERGGGVVLLGGRSFAAEGLGSSGLGGVLPIGPRRGVLDAARVAWLAGEANKLTLTSDGQRHGMLRVASSPDESARRWSTAPPLAGVTPMGPLRPGAQVLAVATSAGVTRPLVAVQRYGEGRAMVFAGEASWLWKMRRPLEDHLYDSFWRQAARWLSAPAPDPIAVDTEADVRPGVPSVVGVTVRDEKFEPIRNATVDIVVRGPNGGDQALRGALSDSARGRYTATWRPSERGLFRVSATVRLSGASATTGRVHIASERSVLSGGADLETADLRRHDDVLARLAEGTGGRLISERDLPLLTAALKQHVDASPTLEIRELWHGPWTFLTVIALLSVEWTLRRRWGLR